MLIIHALYQLKPGTRADFERESIEIDLIDQTLKEKGNLEYTLCHPVGDEDSILIIERWADAESFEGHLKSAHVATLQGIKKKYLENMIRNKYKVVD